LLRARLDACGEPLTMLGVVKGPGSFTGIRTALACALGLRAATAVPALGFSKFELLAFCAGGGDYRLVLPYAPAEAYALDYRAGRPLGEPFQAAFTELAADGVRLVSHEAIQGLAVEVHELCFAETCLDMMAAGANPADHDLD